MDNSDIGESSCRRKTSNDKMSDSERPLKKAKYAWQVKGRYHLKDQEEVSDISNQDNNSSAIPAPISNDEITETIITDDIEISSQAEENLEILGDYLLKQQDFSLNSLKVSSGVSSTEDKPEINSEVILEPLVLPSGTQSDTKSPIRNYLDYLELEQSTSQRSPTNELVYEPERSPPTMGNKKLLKTEDQYLARWQARQIAKGFVDNTINRVLDSWLVAPLPQTYEDNHNVVMDVAEFFDNLPANNAVENEGILMAISAHGLQNQSGSHSESRLQSGSFSPRICTIGLVEPGLRLDYDSSPTRNSTTTQYIFSSNSDDNDRNIFFGGSSSLSNRNSNDSEASHDFDVTSEGKDTKVTDCNTHNSASSSETQAWRHLSQACNCSHIPRRTNVTPNIPFHRRDTLDQLMHTSPTREENHLVREDVPATSLADDSKKDDSLTDDKSSDDSVNEEYTHNIINPSTDNYPIPGEMNQPFDEHFDFMDAAVSFAIQNKGLTSFNSVDYG